MPRQLKNLRIDEVSSVDRGAGEGVRVMLMKRHGVEADDHGGVVIDLAKLRVALGEATDGSVDTAKLAVAVDALRKSIASINSDDAVVDKAASINESLGQFYDHLGLTVHKQESEMTPAEIAKMIEEGVTKALKGPQDQIAKLTFERDWALLPAAHQEFAKAMSDEDKKKFMDKKPDERDADCKKAIEDAAGLGGNPIVKALTGEVESLRKRLAASDEKEEIAKFAKQAKDLGLPETHGEVMRKAFAGDSDAIAKHNELIKGLTEQIKTGKVFAEFGAGAGTGAGVTAMDQLTQKAVELRKLKPELTEAQAFDKVYNDPANAELRQADKAEEMKKRGIAA